MPKAETVPGRGSVSGAAAARRGARRDCWATEAHREVAKKANAILRQKKLTVPEKQAALAELGLSEPTITNRLRFGPFHMANISSEVRRIKQRIAQLRDLAEDKARGEYEAYQRGPWSVTWDDEDGRVRVQGPKPATREATRAMSAKFKARGFRWSPRNQAYQRQATENAWYAARNIVDEITEGIETPPPGEPEPPAEVRDELDPTVTVIPHGA